jgi:hypothetical protein
VKFDYFGFPLHIYMGTNMNTDLDWLYYINSVFIIILGKHDF